jgi:hypothetical protein
MGDGTEVDLDRLRATANRVVEVADRVNEIDWPTDAIDDALPGSTVATVDTTKRIADRVGKVAQSQRSWAVAARGSADAFERADEANAGRFPR